MTTRAGTPETPGAASLIERLRTALGGRYLIDREIGHGAMATVYLARDLKHDRQVAIKVLADDLATTIGATRFLREIHVAAQLLHPNILGLIDSGEAQGALYYIMPFVRGETLRDKLAREKRLSVGEAVRIACEVASALEHAHEYGVIHRDIKPENILLVNGHHATVADFGLARAVFNASSTDRTSTGLVVGSPYYMSPEQATGEQDLDGRTDIYSLGCVLFEMLTGGPPFHGKTVQSVLMRQLTSPVPKLRTRRADLSPRLDEIVQRALAKAPAERFQSAREMLDALADVSQGGRVVRTARANWLHDHRRIAIPAVIAAVAGGLLLFPFSREIGNRASMLLGADLDTTRYAVMPFHRAADVASNFDVELFMHDGIQRWEGVDVIDQFQIEGRLSSRRGDLTHSVARSAAIHFRAGRYVWGDVAVAGDSLRINAALYDTRTGRALHREQMRIPATEANVGAGLSRLAEALLFRGDASGRTAASSGTTSFAAQQAYHRGHNALEDWNLIEAEQAFEEAIEHDRDYASAHLWLAQVRGWVSEQPRDWSALAERAAAGSAQLSGHERQLARALVALADQDLPQACAIYKRLKSANPSDFVATYGIGECNRRDTVVVADAKSESGWSFRGSLHAASQAYREAFELMPELHKAFQAQAFGRVRSLIFTSSNFRRFGRALPPDTTRFRASPSLRGDTLAFVPYPLHEEIAHPERLRSTTTVQAINRQRALFREVAAAWRRAYPESAETMEAMAIAVEMLGDSTALDTLRTARRMAGTDGQRTRLAANEVLMMIKFALPDNAAGLAAARALADSVLAAADDAVDEDANLMASIAAVTGRAHLAARLARRSRSSGSRVGARTVATSQALLAYSSLGWPVDSIRVLEKRIITDVRNTVAASDQARELLGLLGRAAGLAFPVYRFASMDQIAGPWNRLLEAQHAHAAGNSSGARDILASEDRQRASRRPSDFTLDITYPSACLLVEVDGTAAALARLDPVLNAAPMYPPGHLIPVANAGAFMRALLLRAELARRAGDMTEAARWERSVDILWVNADAGLKASIKATHQRLSP